MTAIAGLNAPGLELDLFEAVTIAVGDAKVLYEGIYADHLTFRVLPGTHPEQMDALNALVMKRLHQDANPIVEDALSRTLGLMFCLGTPATKNPVAAVAFQASS